jgi:hypothetical protein
MRLPTLGSSASTSSLAMCKHKDTVVIDDTVVCMDCDHERELEW